MMWVWLGPAFLQECCMQQCVSEHHSWWFDSCEADLTTALLLELWMALCSPLITC